MGTRSHLQSLPLKTHRFFAVGIGVALTYYFDVRAYFCKRAMASILY